MVAILKKKQCWFSKRKKLLLDGQYLSNWSKLSKVIERKTKYKMAARVTILKNDKVCF
jgi:hypothetical protein